MEKETGCFASFERFLSELPESVWAGAIALKWALICLVFPHWSPLCVVGATGQTLFISLLKKEKEMKSVIKN